MLRHTMDTTPLLTAPRHPRVIQPVWVWVALYLLVSVLSLWLYAGSTLIRATDPRAFAGFDGVESSPDGQIVYRWGDAQPTIQIPAARPGWRIMSMHVVAAAPDAQLTVTSADTVLATSPLQNGAFRHYQQLIWLPPTTGDGHRFSLAVTPVVDTDGRTLGVAVTEFTLLRTTLGIPARPPLTGLSAVLLSALLLAAVGSRGRWSHNHSALVVAGFVAPWALVLDGAVPLQLAIVGAGARSGRATRRLSWGWWWRRRRCWWRRWRWRWQSSAFQTRRELTPLKQGLVLRHLSCSDSVGGTATCGLNV